MTRFNIISGTVIVPTLARIILCAAFLTAGWNKVMHTMDFTGEDARTLIDLGVVEAPAPTITPASWRDDTPDEPETPQADEQTEPAAAPDEPVDEPAPAQQPQTGNADASDAAPAVSLPEVPEIPQPPADVVTEDPVTGQQVVSAKRLHAVTIAVERNSGPAPVTMAWVAAITELVGGALLLLGLFSRIWAMGLAIAMGVAFYLTSMPLLTEMNIFGVAADMTGGYANFNKMYVQLSLLVLALGVVLTGPGPLSLDRLLVRPNHRRDDDLDLDTMH